MSIYVIFVSIYVIYTHECEYNMLRTYERMHAFTLACMHARTDACIHACTSALVVGDTFVSSASVGEHSGRDGIATRD